MAEPGDEQIDGDPEAMRGVNFIGPARVDPTLSLLTGGMAEGAAFAKVDSVASKDLAEFMFAATHSFESYCRTARDAGHVYFEADQEGAGVILDVTNAEKHPYYA
jgi:hypothetical protein